ncbi:MAG: ferredoxin [Mycobacterium sp.]
MNAGNPPTLTVHVEKRMCEGHALCLDLAPTVFDLSNDETASCTEHPDPSQLAQIMAAAAACPRQAITVTRRV